MNCLGRFPAAGLVAGLAVGWLSPAVADEATYQDGFAAYESGDYGRAYGVWLPLATAGDSDAQFGLGVLLDNGQGVPESDADAAKWYRQPAEKGNPDAQFNLALLYDSGSGVPVDKTEAARWYYRAAMTGHAGAQYNLGLMFESGEGVDQDPARAAFWYRQAADQGHVKAQNNLGVLYDKGLGVPQDRTEAAKWYRRAAEKGFARAQFNLGVMCDFGTGLPEDDREAAKWYRKAAQQGDQEAQFNLALMLDTGEDEVAADKAEAALWYRKAAEQGNDAAANNLGALLDSGGPGVPQDAAGAALWYGRAADHGNANAQRNLGILYRDGRGVAQDLVTAYFWLTLAIDTMASGPEREQALEDRTDLAERMERPEIQEAKARVKQWTARGPEQRNVVLIPPPSDLSDPNRSELDSTGSGFFVSRSGEVLTNQHVITGCADLTLKLGREKLGPATVLATDADHDLALLRSGTSVMNWARFRMGPPLRPGDELVAVGYPLRGLLASEANIATGTVSANAGLHDDPAYMQISAPVQPGNSGGPLLDRFGLVSGIVSAKLDALEVADSYGDIPQNVNFAIKGDVAVGFLNRSGRSPEGLAPAAPKSAADIGDLARPYTVLVECWK